MIQNLKKWLIMKLAGDTLVILNSTIIYKYYPIFADTTKNPIIEKNNVIKHDIDTPFNIYSNDIFETLDAELKIKDEYAEAYNSIVEDIKKQSLPKEGVVG